MTTTVSLRSFQKHAVPMLAKFRQISVHFLSSGRLSKAQTMEVEIISKENIKPASPTPHHLRTYKISLLDQLFPPVYAPMVLFYPNTQSTTSLTDIIRERSQHLKQSLSETLTRFYPFAGKIKDDLSIDCNDEGVHYVEARVNYHLSDILSQPDGRLIQQLLPHDPKSSAGLYVVMVQVNFFDCGGIAISMCTSHRIIDGQTHGIFWKAWVATARGASGQVCPSFIAPSLFAQNPSLPKHATLFMWPTFGVVQSKCVRCVFDASALIALKAKATTSSSFVQNPTRVEAVSALIWKCAITAYKSRRGCQRPSVLSLPVNLRRKMLPPLPEYSIGNLIWSTVAQCMPDEIELDCLVGHLRKAIAKINSDFVEEIRGDEGFVKGSECLKELGDVCSNNEADYFSLTSMCNSGLYEADFGWGNPVWVSLGNAGTDDPALVNLIFLMDTRSGDGIEAWVNLSEQEMSVFECDPELLAFASLDPSPLSCPL